MSDTIDGGPPPSRMFLASFLRWTEPVIVAAVDLDEAMFGLERDRPMAAGERMMLVEVTDRHRRSGDA